MPTATANGIDLNYVESGRGAGYKSATTWERQTKSASPKVISFEQARQTATPLKYKAGMRVMHPKLGEGMVIDSRRSGQDEEVPVHFKQYGTKLMLANYANLLILDK